MSHDNTAAELLQQSIITSALGTAAVDAAAWPVYVNHLPDGAADPDNAICVYDTQGTTDGRYMRTGVVVEHPGWQVRVRALTHPVGSAKITSLKKHIDSILNEQVDVGGDLYKLLNVSRKGNILPLGHGNDHKKRNAFTLNGIMTIEDVEP